MQKYIVSLLMIILSWGWLRAAAPLESTIPEFNGVIVPSGKLLQASLKGGQLELR